MLNSDTCIIILSIVIIYMIFKKNNKNSFSVGGTIENNDQLLKCDPVTQMITITC